MPLTSRLSPTVYAVLPGVAIEIAVTTISLYVAVTSTSSAGIVKVVVAEDTSSRVIVPESTIHLSNSLSAEAASAVSVTVAP